MCSGRVDPVFVMEGFKSGADAVMVGGCKLGECKYLEGNFQALIMGEMIKLLLKLLGLKEERFKLEWVSSAEPAKLVEDLKNFGMKIKEIGPLGKAEGINEEDLNFYLECAIEVCKNRQVRTIYANIAKELKELQDFSIESIVKKVEEKLHKPLKTKLYEIEIKALIKDGPKSIDYLAKKTGTTVEELTPILSRVLKSEGG